MPSTTSRLEYFLSPLLPLAPAEEAAGRPSPDSESLGGPATGDSRPLSDGTSSAFIFGTGRPTRVAAGGRRGRRCYRRSWDPVLHEPSRDVDPAEINKIVDDMIRVMRQAPGVGLAAPQIGIPHTHYEHMWDELQQRTVSPTFFTIYVLKITLRLSGIGKFFGQIREAERQIREAERFHWEAIHGVDEEKLLGILPGDLQRGIRRHLFAFLNRVRGFDIMDEHVLDVICGRLRQTLYIVGSYIQSQNDPIEKIFITRRRIGSIGSDGSTSPLSDDYICGEEFLTWFLPHLSIEKGVGNIRSPRHTIFSNKTIKCMTNVEAYAIYYDDLKDVAACF